MDLHVKFDGHEIIITRPGTDMMTAYRKASDRPDLILTRSWEKPTVTSPEISEFRANAFRAAVNKARERAEVRVLARRGVTSCAPKCAFLRAEV